MDPDVGWLYISVDPPQPGGTWMPSRSSPVKWWFRQYPNDLVMILLQICLCHACKEAEQHLLNKRQTEEQMVVSATVYTGSGKFYWVTLCQKHPQQFIARYIDLLSICINFRKECWLNKTCVWLYGSVGVSVYVYLCECLSVRLETAVRWTCCRCVRINLISCRVPSANCSSFTYWTSQRTGADDTCTYNIHTLMFYRPC